ncbi:filamentous hemagglutinin family protein [Termitidicoccus mucosus]|uniref:filamentous haemagglutinin family protein n=1 Tax=Termitidicoccus mucosus TaxID=1184151 RepID=UPI0031841742
MAARALRTLFCLSVSSAGVLAVLVIALIPAPLSAASLVGSVRAKAGGGAAASNPSGGTGGQAVDPATATALAQAQKQSLVRTVRAIAAARQAQADARRAALNGLSSFNGLATSDNPSGGLKIANGVDLDPSLWQGAARPVETSGENGRLVVKIDQETQKAILTWDRFDVGRETDLVFDQQGNRDWVALNRVTDAQTSPSQILGSIKADGSVYVLNRNGVIFGGASQVNVGNLVAAAANMTNAQFLDRGLYGSSITVPSFTDALGAVTVEAGARITTREPASATEGGGSVLLLGSAVTNAGEITTRKGQTLLAAGDSFILRRGVSTEENKHSTTRGTEVSPQFKTDSTAGAVANTGLIVAREGDITLAGRDVRQDGVAVATTSVNTRGTVHLLTSANDKDAAVALGADSVTAIIAGDLLIEDDRVELRDDGQTALDSQRDALIAESAALDQARVTEALANTTKFDNYSTLSDRRDQSRIEIVGGGLVTFEGDSLALATGGQIAVSAGNSAAGTKDVAVSQVNPLTWGEIRVADGAQLDVSGALGVRVAMEDNNIKVNIQGFELRDSPLNRDNPDRPLFNQDVWIDRRDLTYVPAGTDGYESDRYYTGGGLIEAGGYLANQAHGIGEWTAQGGTVNFIADSVVTEAGSLIDLSGGSLDVQSGYLTITRVLGSDGKLYDLGSAPADLVYYALGNAHVEYSEKWGVTKVYSNSLTSQANVKRYEQGYTVGRDAGQFSIRTIDARLDGAIDASVTNGTRQRDARPAAGAADGYKLSQTQAALAGRLLIQNYDPSAGSFNPRREWYSDVLLAAGDAAPPPSAGADAAPADRLIWLNLDRLNDAGLGGLSIQSRLNTFVIGGDLALAPGGALDFSGGDFTLNGSLTARGGSVHIQTGGQYVNGVSVAAGLTLKDGVTIDTRGLWTNVALDPDSAWGLAFRDGGSVTIDTGYGDLVMEAGSRIDASAGGAVLADASTVGGAGGDITLSGRGMRLEGELVSRGFTKGGKLALNAWTNISVGGRLLETDGLLAVGEVAPMDLTLAEDTVFPAGSQPPFSFEVVMSEIKPGDPLPGTYLQWGSYSNHPNPMTTGVDFIVPSGMSLRTSGGTPSETEYNTGSLIPAGTKIGYIYAWSWSAGYAFPVELFSEPIPLPSPIKTTYPADTILTKDLTVAAGTIIPKGASLTHAVKVRAPLNMDAEFFRQGFSDYSLASTLGVTVHPGAQIDVVMPVYRFNAASLSAPTGADIADVADFDLPPLFTENPAKGTLTQRAGASLALKGLTGSFPTVGTPIISHGAVVVGQDAAITVDPGQRVRLSAAGQLTVDGAITARGGEIIIANSRTIFESPRASNSPNLPVYPGPGETSVWIGENARLDASGLAVTARDFSGRDYGLVTDGGSIVLGSEGVLRRDPDGLTQTQDSTEAWVIVRPGAVLDVSGASAVLDLPVGAKYQARTVASHGGSISLTSYSGIFLDGELRARAGGEGASAGALNVVIEAPRYTNVQPSQMPAALMQGRVLAVGQEHVSSLSADLRAGEADEAFVIGSLGAARVSVEQITAGGFDSVSLWGRNGIVFDGDVSLSLGRSLTLSKGYLGNSAEGARVSLAAPYVYVDGWSVLNGGGSDVYPDRVPVLPAGGSFDIAGGLVDFRHLAKIDYDQVRVESAGDLRFLPSVASTSSSSLDRRTLVQAPGELTLAAAQLYPTSNTLARVTAGDLLAIERVGAETPAVPLSVFGQLELGAQTVRQGGIVRAPLGSITLTGGLTNGGLVELLDGSITSVSANGLLMPYGGTADGVDYLVNGEKAVTSAILGAYVGAQGVVTVNADSFHGEAGSLLDLSGGGHLLGGAFVTGRGGSVDTLLYPRNPGGQVFAIVPGVVTAPVAGGYASQWTGAVPEAGQTITIPAGVPGLPAGTYTLLPANYALLPGAFRVELGAATSRPFAGVTAQRDGSFAMMGVQGVAGTGIRDALPNLVTVTPGAVFRTWAHYNEQSFAAYQVEQAGIFGNLRPRLEADGKYLTFSPGDYPEGDANSALVFDGLADFSAAPGGYDGGFALSSSRYVNLVITAPGSATENRDTADRGAYITVSSDALDRVNAPNLYIGGVPSQGATALSVSTGGMGQLGYDLLIEGGVTLRGSQVILASRDTITLESGATIDTLGRGIASPDSSSGLLFGDAPTPYGELALLAVSNGLLVLNSPAGLNTSSITLGEGVSLRSEGSIGFYSDRGLNMEGSARFGTRNLFLTVPSFNIGSSDALAAAGPLPDGMILNQSILDGLLAGDPASGAPAVETLILGASQSINFFGDIALNTIDPATGRSSLAQLVFNSPALYGYGSAADTVRLTTDTFVWNGAEIFEAESSYGLVSSSARPGALRDGGAGSGRFVIDAGSIVFGYPSPARPDTSITFDRLMLGFSDVAFNASSAITANARGTLSVYQTGDNPAALDVFDPAAYVGAGGALHLNTPLLTGDSAAFLHFHAGGPIDVTAPSAATSAPAASGLGAEIGLHTASSIDIASSIVLHSGRLTLSAAGDITLADAARLDLSGLPVVFHDVTRHTWGGDASLESTSGNITHRAGAQIDLSAPGEDAGLLTLSALSGRVRLDGELLATGGEGHDGGSFDLRARLIADDPAALSSAFAALNTRLTQDGFSAARSFRFTEGDLLIGDGLKARDISVSVDNGSLTVNGLIDASGPRPGSIRLASRDDLRLASTAVLDVRGTEMQLDGYGQPVEALNRAHIELSSAEGWLRLDAGATLDLSSPDGVDRGRLTLNARRADETGGDINIDASGPLDIRGADSIALNAYWTYSPADENGSIVQDNGTDSPISSNELQTTTRTLLETMTRTVTVTVTTFSGESFPFGMNMTVGYPDYVELNYALGFALQADYSTYPYVFSLYFPGQTGLKSGKATLVSGKITGGDGTVYNPGDKIGQIVMNDATFTDDVMIDIDGVPSGTQLFGCYDASGNGPYWIKATNANREVISQTSALVALDTPPSIDTVIDDSTPGRLITTVTNVELLKTLETTTVMAPPGTAIGNVNTVVTTPDNLTKTTTDAETYADPQKGFAGLDQIDAQNQLFHANALADTALQNRLAGLKARGDAFHLRPGVEITGGDASGGKLTVPGDLDLSRYRYGPAADRAPASASYGAGEPLALQLRAPADLVIKGSITDGFAQAKPTPDDRALLLAAGRVAADTVLTFDLNLPAGTKFDSGSRLPFAVTFPGPQELPGGETAATAMVLWNVPYNQTAWSYVFAFPDASDLPVVEEGRVDVVATQGGTPKTYLPGDQLPRNLAEGTIFHAGTKLRSNTPANATVKFSGLTIGAYNRAPVDVVLAKDFTTGGSAERVGGNQYIRLPDGTEYNARDNPSIPPGTLLPRGTIISAQVGFYSGNEYEVESFVIPPGTSLPKNYILTNPLPFLAGDTLPAGTNIAETLYDAQSRLLWAVAPMLAPGSLSADIRLAAGADLSAADARALLPAHALAAAGHAGNLTLDNLRRSNISQPGLNVIRTGIGSLDLLAGGDFTQTAPYGIYTAGTDTELPGGGDEAFRLPRPPGIVLGATLADWASALGERSVWYPDHGGDLTVTVQGDLSAYTYKQGGLNNQSVSNWLWKQGGDDALGIKTAWGLNFGTFIPVTYNQKPAAALYGFSGFGALGGGNVRIRVGGDAGVLASPVSRSQYGGTDDVYSTSLLVAVGSTGRVTSVTTRDGVVTGGEITQTGGGDIDVRIGGRLNPFASFDYLDMDGGSFTNLRGDIRLEAAAIGFLKPAYGALSSGDPRAPDIYAAGGISSGYAYTPQGAPQITPGDGSVAFRTRGNLSVNVPRDATMGDIYSANTRLFDYQPDPASQNTALTWFSLWRDDTAVSLFSAGGNIAPFGLGTSGLLLTTPRFYATAAAGSIYYGSRITNSPMTIELVPSATGQLELLAMDSIYAGVIGGPARLAMSGASATLDLIPNPFKPAYILAGPGTSYFTDAYALTNTLIAYGLPRYEGDQGTRTPTQGYFAFQPDMPLTNLHAADADPMRIYAAEGDIVSFRMGDLASSYGVTTRLPVAKAAHILAGRDIVAFGGASGSYYDAPNLILNARDTDVSLLSAGRDIIHANVEIYGPGALEVTAGRNIYQGDNGTLTSRGALLPGDNRPGADIALMAGMANGVAWDALRDLYLDPANLANPELPLYHPDYPENHGKVAKVYDEELMAWLKENYNYEAADSETALAWFTTELKPEEQRVFLRSVYYNELREGGREYNNPESRRFASYLRGRQMIATLFPETDANDNEIVRTGDITMFGGSGIRTLFGGDIQMLAPGGQVMVGMEGQVPPATAGVVTQGAGDIQIYSEGSILLGLSRIMTTFGGAIFGWSAEGDINAGRGSKTTIVYTPPKRVYDNYGNVTLSPTVPSSGAGIATLAPIPEVPAGDVDLIAPLGTIDVGEAGIRVSGNINLAALQVINAANIQVQGDATGIPMAALPNLGALTAATNTAGAATAAAMEAAAGTRRAPAAAPVIPSIITVETVGYGPIEEPPPETAALLPDGVPVAHLTH